jgi:hypothetical protein
MKSRRQLKKDRGCRIPSKDADVKVCILSCELSMHAETSAEETK